MRKATKRKFYNPQAINLKTSLTEYQKNAIGLMGFQSLDLIKRGVPVDGSFDCLACCINVSTVLAQSGKGAEYLDICLQGLQALRNIHKRFLDTGRYVGSGDDYNALAAVLELYRQQAEICTQLDISKAIAEVERRVDEQIRVKNEQLQG